MKNREITIARETEESEIEMKLNIDGRGMTEIVSPVNFLSHMLEIFSMQGLFDLGLQAKDKKNFDEHHIVEDIGIVLGSSFAKALGDKKGIRRFGFFILTMDEVLATATVDFSGRINFNFNCEFRKEKVGDLSAELVYDFWNAFAQNAKCSLFIKIENGRNDHHIIEAIFKSCARAIRMACEKDERLKDMIPSTKGVL